VNAKASAPGKVILLGEHAVVYGHPALAAALERRVHVDLLPADDLRIDLRAPERSLTAPPELARAAAEMAARIGVAPRFVARVVSELPLGGGLGSSAALGVALARALTQLAGQECGVERAAELALGFETFFHGAPSGVDPAICARGGAILFHRGEPPQVRPVALRRPVALAVVLTGVLRGTRSTVLPLSVRRAEKQPLYDPMLAFLGELARGGADALERGDLADLGVRFDAAHGVLSALGVSCPELEGAVAALRGAGALGAKLTGAGGGGAAIGLAEDADHARALLRETGLAGFAAELNP
jgi:mevalonate kinase